MSKTKRTGHAARIAALERDVARLRAQLPKEIHHAVRHELAVDSDRKREVAAAVKAGMKLHALGRDSYSEACND